MILLFGLFLYGFYFLGLKGFLFELDERFFISPDSVDYKMVSENLFNLQPIWQDEIRPILYPVILKLFKSKVWDLFFFQFLSWGFSGVLIFLIIEDFINKLHTEQSSLSYFLKAIP